MESTVHSGKKATGCSWDYVRVGLERNLMAKVDESRDHGGEKPPDYYRISLQEVWDGASEELEATLRALQILRAKRCAEFDLGETPHFLVADSSLPLLEDILDDDGMVLVRQDRPEHLRQCVDFWGDSGFHRAHCGGNGAKPRNC